jgi:glycosyl transferase family 2
MANDKIVLLTLPSDQGDLLEAYLEWHLALGVDLIIAQDCGSTDDTRDILERFSSRGHLEWFTMPDRNMAKHDPADVLARAALESHAPDWLILTDVDEFLCPHGNDLRPILDRARTDGITAITMPCANMTGPMPEPSQSAIEALTLRVDEPVTPTLDEYVSGDIPVPYVFVKHEPKTAAWAPAFVKYGPGTHTVVTTWGKSEWAADLRVLHYPVRGFERLQTKVANMAAFFEVNTHMQPPLLWHWHRWLRLEQEGRLREDYERQFVSPRRAEQLIRDGVCTVDDTIATWFGERRINHAAEG